MANLRRRMAQAWSFAAQRPRIATGYSLAAGRAPVPGPVVFLSLGDRDGSYSAICLAPDGARRVARELRLLNGEYWRVPRPSCELIGEPLGVGQQLERLAELVRGLSRRADKCVVRPVDLNSGDAVVIELGSRHEPEPHAIFGFRPEAGEVLADQFENAAATAEKLPPGSPFRAIHPL